MALKDDLQEVKVQLKQFAYSVLGLLSGIVLLTLIGLFTNRK